MREIVLVAAGLLIGGFFGVTTMCLFQINRDRHYITERTAIKMRKRNIQKIVRLSRDEAQDLQKKAKRSCMSESGLIRLLLKDTSREKSPTKDFTMLCASFPLSATTSISLRQKQTPSDLWMHRSSKRKPSVGTSFRLMWSVLF